MLEEPRSGTLSDNTCLLGVDRLANGLGIPKHGLGLGWGRTVLQSEQRTEDMKFFRSSV
jgi:hypothetical protein